MLRTGRARIAAASDDKVYEATDLTQEETLKLYDALLAKDRIQQLRGPGVKALLENMKFVFARRARLLLDSLSLYQYPDMRDQEGQRVNTYLQRRCRMSKSSCTYSYLCVTSHGTLIRAVIPSVPENMVSILPPLDFEDAYVNAPADHKRRRVQENEIEQDQDNEDPVAKRRLLEELDKAGAEEEDNQ